ncbi:unnamed protein product [Discosporangium mesarthrocarpum]
MVHLDAEQAFIQADIDTEVYVKLPQGCEELSNTVVRLNSALYGLSQGSRRWNDRFTQVLLGLGFDQSKADPCLFRYVSNYDVDLLVAVHVDDMIVVGRRNDCDSLSKALSFEFPTNNLRPLSLYTGCGCAWDQERGQLLI